MKLIAGSYFLAGNRKFQVTQVWFRSGTVDTYEFFEKFEEPQTSEIIIRNAELINDLIKKKQIELL